MTATPVLAAGAVCWRVTDGTPRILLVHRGDRADVSLPKGKLDPGETLPQTAVREIAEETGLTVSLGAPLGVVEYTLPNGREKVVYYWSAEVGEHSLQLARFTPNNEIAGLEWVSIAKARKKLTFAHDVDIVDRFAARFDAGVARTFAIIALRHGKAVNAGSWDGPDATRPLLTRGTEQSVSIAPAVAAFAPERIVSSSAARCVATVNPLSDVTGIPVRETPLISQDAYESGEADIASVVAKRLRKQQTTVLCSHGPVLPEIVEEVARLTGSPIDRDIREAADLATGEYSVMHISRDRPGDGIVALETHGPFGG